jgi:hypothetical protein
MRLEIYVYESPSAPGLWWAGVSYGAEPGATMPDYSARLGGLETDGMSRSEALESLSDTLRWLSNLAKEKKIEDTEGDG